MKREFVDWDEILEMKALEFVLLNLPTMVLLW